MAVKRSGLISAVRGDVVEVITVHIIGINDQPTSLFTKGNIYLIELLTTPDPNGHQFFFRKKSQMKILTWIGNTVHDFST